MKFTHSAQLKSRNTSWQVLKCKHMGHLYTLWANEKQACGRKDQVVSCKAKLSDSWILAAAAVANYQ